MSMKYPKVLVVCSGISKSGELAMTTLNLFQGWPKEKLLMVGYDYAGNYGEYFVDAFVTASSLKENNKSFISGRFKKLDFFKKTLKAKNNFRQITENPFDSKRFSDLIKWVKNQSPDIVYGMVGGSLSNIPYILALMDEIDVPFVIHIADDWVSRNYFGLLGYKYNKLLNKQFTSMLHRADSVMTISQMMADEYGKRYNVKAEVFHNPVPASHWSKVSKPKDDKTFNIMYFGSIEEYHQDGIIKLNKAINILKNHGISAKGIVYGSIKNKRFEKTIKSLVNIEFRGYVKYAELPEKISEAHVLYLPFSFKKRLVDAIKLSMPTKLTEYMYCPQPILVFASSKSALFEFVKSNDLGHCVDRDSSIHLANTIQELYENADLREMYVENAHKVALESFTTDKASLNFQNKLRELT